MTIENKRGKKKNYNTSTNQVHITSAIYIVG